MFQNFNLFPHYSVMKNIIDAPIHVQRKSKQEAVQTAKALLEKMGLTGKEDSYPCQLSGGQSAAGRHCAGAGNESFHFVL